MFPSCSFLDCVRGKALQVPYVPVNGGRAAEMSRYYPVVPLEIVYLGFSEWSGFKIFLGAKSRVSPGYQYDSPAGAPPRFHLGV